MSPTDISPQPNAPSPSPLAPVTANMQESRLLAGTVSNLVAGTNAVSSPTSNPVPGLLTLHANQWNGEIFGDSGPMEDTDDVEPAIEALAMLGVSGVTVNLSGDNAKTAGAVAFGASFPVVQPIINNRFTNQDDDLYNQGYDSEGGQLYYDPVALDDD